LLGIGFEVYFLGFFLNSKSIESEIKLLALWFNLVVVLIILFCIVFVVRWQKQINFKKSQQIQLERQKTQTTLNSLT
jgi:hypothetical protein